MADRSTERARWCFKVAADERCSDGERAAALNRGMAIVERAGLNPDSFDIPGRERAAPKPGEPWGGTGRSPWLDGFERMEAMRDAGMAFSMDAMVREAVREAMRRRRNRAFMDAMNTGADPIRSGNPVSGCKHGVRLYGTTCVQCEREAR